MFSRTWKNELQINPRDSSIRVVPNVIKHLELLPGDSPAMRDRYGEIRYKAAASLAQHGVITNLNVVQAGLGWESRMKFSADVAEIDALLRVLRSTFGNGRSRLTRAAVR